MKSIDFDEAMAGVRRESAVWSRVRPRLAPRCHPEVRPSFTIPPGGSVFTIGSCFARNIEEHIARLGYAVPMMAFAVPPEEFHGRPNGILNKYTPPSIHQEVAWAAAIHDRDGRVRPEDCEPFLYEAGSDAVIDNNLAGFRPVPRARFFERRVQVYETVRRVFEADCVVITPGLIEAWYDTERGLFIQETPATQRSLLRRRHALKLVLLDYADCHRYLQETIALVRGRNPRARFLITTSPVPLGRTFTGEDILVANTYGKSVLRAACGAICAENEEADYFPSYETVMLTRDWGVVEEDLAHVTDACVGAIVGQLTGTYFAGAVPAAGPRPPAQAPAAAGEGPGDDARARPAAPGAAGVREARRLLRTGDHATAERTLQAVLAAEPDRAEAHFVLALLREHRDDLDGALESALRAFELSGGAASTAERLALVLFRLGRHGEAEGHVRAALALKPAEASAHALLARVLLAQGRRAEAQEVITAAIRSLGAQERLEAALVETLACAPPVAGHAAADTTTAARGTASTSPA